MTWTGLAGFLGHFSAIGSSDNVEHRDLSQIPYHNRHGKSHNFGAPATARKIHEMVRGTFKPLTDQIDRSSVKIEESARRRAEMNAARLKAYDEKQERKS